MTCSLSIGSRDRRRTERREVDAFRLSNIHLHERRRPAALFATAAVAGRVVHLRADDVLAGRAEGGRRRSFEDSGRIAIGDERDPRSCAKVTSPGPRCLRQFTVMSGARAPARAAPARSSARAADDLTADDRDGIDFRRAAADTRFAQPRAPLRASFTFVGTSDAHNVSATGFPTVPDNVCAVPAGGPSHRRTVAQRT